MLKLPLKGIKKKSNFKTGIISNLTAIIPIDLKRRSKDLIKKAITLSAVAQENNIPIVFGHNNRGTNYDKQLIEKLKSFPLAKINSVEKKSESINSSFLRNVAFEQVTTEYIILLDVDIHPDFSLFNKYKERIENSIKPFYVFPCLYLTKHGTKLLQNGKVTTEELKNRFFSFSRKEFLHLASPSSITIFKADDYRKIEGFDVSYRGHGYEDFDFLVRLYQLHNLMQKPIDFLTDISARSPLFAVGFRRYLGEHCLDVLLEKQMAFHLYHDKDNRENYYVARKENYKKFAKTHGSDIAEITENHPTLLIPFIKLCANKGFSIHDYSILFDNKPGHIDRFDTFRRRIRFLFNSR